MYCSIETDEGANQANNLAHLTAHGCALLRREPYGQVVEEVIEIKSGPQRVWCRLPRRVHDSDESDTLSPWSVRMPVVN